MHALLTYVTLKRVWRTTEWVLALAWPIVAYYAMFKRYGWNSPYYNQWSEAWFALALLIPMVGPVLFRLFSASEMLAQKRFAVLGLMALGVALAIKFRPHFGGVSLMGFYVPMALYAMAVALWLFWPGKNSWLAKLSSSGTRTGTRFWTRWVKKMPRQIALNGRRPAETHKKAEAA